jgi:hypothetical protein
MRFWTHLKGHWQLIALTAVVFALWQNSLVIPLKIFVVFLHEFSHAIATLLTGGKVLELSVSAQQGGFVTSQGGNGFIIATAGYLGSLLLGSLLFVLALRSKLDRYVVGALGLIMVGLTALYIRELFAVGFCLGAGLVLMISARFFAASLNDLILRVIGLTSMIYVPYDIFSDTLSRSYLMSDARILAQNYGGTTMMWGVIWLIISLVFLIFILKASLKTPSNITFKDAPKKTS